MPDKEFVGGALSANWIWFSSGTVLGGTETLNTESRNFSYGEALETIDATAGSDSTRRKIASFKNATASMTMTAQSDGTALIAACAAGIKGTLIFGEAGTANGSPKTTMPALCLGISRSVPYADVVTYDISWESNGDPIYGSY